MKKHNHRLIFAILASLLFIHSSYASDTPPTVRAAAEAGNADAQFYLGLQYDDGNGVEKNKLEKAMFLLRIIWATSISMATV